MNVIIGCKISVKNCKTLTNDHPEDSLHIDIKPFIPAVFHARENTVFCCVNIYNIN